MYTYILIFFIIQRILLCEKSRGFKKFRNSFEKIEGASFSGTNSKSGDLLTIKIYNNTATTAIMPNKVYVTLVADQIMSISDTGISVFDYYFFQKYI